MAYRKYQKKWRKPYKTYVKIVTKKPRVTIEIPDESKEVLTRGNRRK